MNVSGMFCKMRVCANVRYNVGRCVTQTHRLRVDRQNITALAVFTITVVALRIEA